MCMFTKQILRKNILGLPVCDIDCDYDIDVQQKVPLSTDRNSVAPSFLKKVFGELLNHVYEEITEDNSSRVWVRTAITSDVITKEATEDIFEKRFGDKALSVNPNDPNALDRAISAGYKPIYGSEMDKEEWKTFKNFGCVSSTSDKFGSIEVDADIVPDDKITDSQRRIAAFAKRVARETLNIEINNVFIKSPKASTVADYGGRTIRWNVSRIAKSMWEITPTNTPGANMIDLICEAMLKLMIHELAHEKGTHYETAYHEAISSISTKLVFKAIKDPSWFKV